MAGKATQKRAPSKKTPRRVMVIVHGGGDIPEDYYNNLVNAIEERLGRSFDFISVYYSDVVTGRALGVAPLVSVDSPEAKEFKAKFEKQLRDTHARNQADKRARGIRTPRSGGTILDNAIADTINEVFQYLFNPSVAGAVQARLVEALDQATREYDEIVLVSHSLGAVVSFDVLRRFASRYKIAYWFTLGCPLVKLVKMRCRDTVLGEVGAPHIARWYNAYDTNDFFADAIGACFHAPNCRVHDIFVEVAPNMPAAHDYFVNGETQDMLAEAMRGNDR
jgi:hypothetical protein